MSLQHSAASEHWWTACSSTQRMTISGQRGQGVLRSCHGVSFRIRLEIQCSAHTQWPWYETRAPWSRSTRAALTADFHPLGAAACGPPVLACCAVLQVHVSLLDSAIELVSFFKPEPRIMIVDRYGPRQQPEVCPGGVA